MFVMKITYHNIVTKQHLNTRREGVVFSRISENNTPIASCKYNINIARLYELNIFRHNVVNFDFLLYFANKK